MVSDAVCLFSVAKFMELIIYDDTFVPNPEFLCEHVSDRHNVIRCVRIDNKNIFRVETEAVE
jgi:hypothetical protein